MASRAAIEQAKGILMLLTNCGDQVAFDLLAHISSHTHRKVRDVAVAITESASGHGRLPDDIRGILRDACPPS
jgi:AmiR/NasT family two-component response regulator